MISICGWSAHHKLSGICSVRLLRIGAGFQHAGDFLPSKWLNLDFLKARRWDVLHRTFDVKFGICPAKERAHRNPNIAQCFRRQIARVPAPPARDIFSSHVNEIGINVVVCELSDILIPRKFRPMFQDPSVGVNGPVGQSFGRFIIYKAGDCLLKWQRVQILLPLEFMKNSFLHMVFGLAVPITPKIRVGQKKV